jgi:hypothetical protein
MLLVALISSVVLAVLLSPLGFERRPSADLTIVGFVPIGAVALGVVLDVAAVILLFRGSRRAAVVAIIGSVAFLIPSVTDKAGAFFSLPAPPVISVLEYVHVGVVFVTLFLAWSVYRHGEGGELPRRDA